MDLNFHVILEISKRFIWCLRVLENGMGTKPKIKKWKKPAFSKTW